MTEAIRTEHLKFSYDAQSESGGVMVFDDLNLSIEEGSFIAVLGHNGCGKSTLAKHFNAVLLPEGGSVHVFGMDTSDESLLVDIRRTVGMVFQNPDNQMVANVVEEDVAFGPENIGVESRQIWQRVEESLQSVGMSAYRYASPMHLSGGQKQRVAIAGIVAMRPKCIVLDEPTAMLDPKGRESVIKTIKELNRKEKITIVLITHYMEEIVDADYVYVMGDGQVVTEGTPKEVFVREEALRRCKLDVPEITKIATALQAAGLPVDKATLTEDELMEQLLR